MNENLNLLEILKDCHKGTKFYSRFLGSVEFCNITSDNYIEVMDKNECHIEFKPNGTYKHSEENAEIDLFPSKEQRDWSKWHSPFVKGDILVSEKGNIVLCSHIDEEQLVHYHCILNFWGDFEIYNGTGVGYSYNCNLANNSQKQRLFDALKKEGYEWDDTTKTLKKLIEPKFKDEDKIHLWTIQDAKEGDVLAINWYEGYDYWEKIVIFKKYHNEGANSPCVEGYGNTFKNRKLAFNDGVPYFSKTWTSCLEPATKEQRDFLFQTIKEAGYKWIPETKTLEKLIKPNFKDGDIVATNDGKYIAIIKNNGGKYYVCCHPNVNYFNIDRSGWFDRLATLEEKEKLFAYIKENGYKWNAKTKTLEKLIVPKFKEGDRIRKKGECICGIIKCIDIDNFYNVEYSNGTVSFVNVNYQNEYELVPNKFDPKTLRPFYKVLVADSLSKTWYAGFLSHIDEENKTYPFVVCFGHYRYCIPYNDDTKYLAGKPGDPPMFYRYWEE